MSDLSNSASKTSTCLVVGGKPVQFLALRREIPSETTATRKVTVKPLRYRPLQEQVDMFN